MYIVDFATSLNLCDFYWEWIMHIFSERSENIISSTELNAGHVPEINTVLENPGRMVTLSLVRLLTCSCI